MMKLEEMRNISVIGAGIMGHGLALTYALGGYQVILNDVSDTILDAALEQVRDILELYAERNLIQGAEIKGVLSRISVTTDLHETVASADFVTEAIVEDITEKRKLFKMLDAMCPGHTIIASNTSSLLIKDFAANITNLERLNKILITHWFNPPHIIPVVEVVQGDHTSEETVNLVCELLEKVRKVPIKIAREIPGFLVNRVQSAMFREVLSLWEQGVATIKDIDLAIKGSMGFRLASFGPFEIADLGGVDTWYRVAENLFKVLDNSRQPPRQLKEMVDRGKLGLKTGKGFYDYSEDSPQEKRGNKIKARDIEFLERLKRLY